MFWRQLVYSDLRAGYKRFICKNTSKVTKAIPYDIASAAWAIVVAYMVTRNIEIVYLSDYLVIFSGSTFYTKAIFGGSLDFTVYIT